MENASKALLMAAGVLIGVLILTFMVSLFVSSKNVADKYEQTKQSDAVQQFNANFTKYLGKDLLVHDVVTICNFADIKNNKVKEVTIQQDGKKTVDDIKSLSDYSDSDSDSITIYKLTIVSFDSSGYVDNISFTTI